MNQLTVNVENSAMLETLKRVISAFDGVTVTEKKAKRKTCELDRALEDVRTGRLYGPYDSIDSLLKDLQS